MSSNTGYFQTVRGLLRLGLPVLVTQVGVIAVSFADTMMVGAYGLNELAASAFVNSLFLVPIVMLLGFSGGMVPVIGALFGRKEHDEIGIMMRASLIVNIGVAAVFVAIMAGLYFFLQYFGQDEDLLPLARDYYLIILLSVLPMSIFACMQQGCNGLTDTSTPMWIIIITDLLNILGNYVLIFGKWGFPELGLNGAGWSTLTARLVSAIAIILVFKFNPRYKGYWHGIFTSHSGRQRRNKIWQTSYPLMVQSGIECGLWTFGAVVSGWFGKVQLAAYQIINTIGQLGFMIYMSFGWAVSIKVANFTGLKNFRAVRNVTRVGLHMILFLATIASAVFLFLTDDMVKFFTPESDVMLYANLLIIPLVLYQYCDGTQLTYVNALRGTSKVKPLLWISTLSYIVVGVPVLLLFALTFGWETMGVYYSFSVALFSAALFLALTFRKTVSDLETAS